MKGIIFWSIVDIAELTLYLAVAAVVGIGDCKRLSKYTTTSRSVRGNVDAANLGRVVGTRFLACIVDGDALIASQVRFLMVIHTLTGGVVLMAYRSGVVSLGGSGGSSVVGLGTLGIVLSDLTTSHSSLIVACRWTISSFCRSISLRRGAVYARVSARFCLVSSFVFNKSLNVFTASSSILAM
jgi:hypothetical protein